MTKYCRPIFAIEMPITKDGAGPASPEETHSILYEVWDGANETICSCKDKETSEHIAKLLDKELI